jgi:hypothetical protein
MGPGDLTDMSSTNNNQALSLPKLRGDGSNWATYSERILNYMTSKGYRRHVQGTARKPETLVECEGKFYKPSSLLVSESDKTSTPVPPLSDDDLEKHEEAIDSYDQMQAAVREIIYRTVDKTTFLQSKMKATPHRSGRKLCQYTLIGEVCTKQTYLSNFRTLAIMKKRV